MIKENLFTKFFLIAVCSSFLFPSLLRADVPSRETAGVEQERFEKAQAEEASRRRQEETEEPQPEVTEEERPSGLPSGEATFVLKSVRVTGNESIPSETLEDLSANFLGSSVSINDLRKIATEIKDYYRERGFIAAYVYLPPQDVTEGVVEIAVVEGRIGKIEIKGNRWFSGSVIKRALGLSAGNILLYKQLRSALTFLNRSPDIKVKSVLKPGIEERTTDIEINVEDKFPVHLATDVNNLGTRDTGETRWGVALSDTNLLGQMDQAESRFQIGKGAWAVGTRYNIPVHSSGTNLGFSYTRSAVDLGGDFKALDVEGDASAYGFEILQPVFRESYMEAGLELGFDWKDIQNKILGAKAGTDNLRILNTGINLDFTDAWGRTFSPHSFHFGFDTFLGGSHKTDSAAIRAGTGGQFFIYRTSLVRYQRLPGDLAMGLRGSAQLSPDSLPPSEQLHLGGAFSVRGYAESEYLSDYGGQFSAELFIPTYFFPADWKLPFSEEPLRRQIQAVTFFDFGAGQLRRPFGGEESSRTLAGAGGGLRVHLFGKVFARFQWAGAVGSTPDAGEKSAFYYGISAEFF